MGGECIWGGLEFDMGCWGGAPVAERPLSTCMKSMRE